MKRIAIIGCGGSGKSTLSMTLNQLLHIPVYHLDALNWQLNWVPRPKDQWDEIQKELVKKEEWIIDGNYNRTIRIRINEADTVIMLDMPRLLCLFRVIKRFFMYRNTSRPDMNEGCKEKLDLKFLKWVWSYNKNIRPEIIEMLNKLDNKDIRVLTRPKEVKCFISDLL